jgi:hypothetical protein
MEEEIKIDLKKYGVRVWKGFIWLNGIQWRAVLNTVIKLRGSIKSGKFIVQLINYQLLKENSSL